MEYVTAKTNLLNLQGDDVHLGKGISLEEIRKVEARLEIRFPESYRLFLKDFGYASIGSSEILGLGEEVFPFRGLNVEKVSLREWYEMKPDYFIPKEFIPFYGVGNGDFHCFDTNRFEDGECPVVWWAHEDFYDYQRDASVLETINANFIEWLNDVIDFYLEDKGG